MPQPAQRGKIQQYWALRRTKFLWRIATKSIFLFRMEGDRLRDTTKAGRRSELRFISYGKFENAT